ncbi:MAG: hypothetical protein ACK5TN_02575 [Acidobacteriota bacterium]|jgi:hypothetical protein
MGAEFIRNATKSFKKRWDYGRIRLATADLFTVQPTPAATCAPFDVFDGIDLHQGDRLTVERSGDQLIARNGLSVVARNPRPPAELLRAVDDSCGIALGTVETMHSIAKVAEISLC